MLSFPAVHRVASGTFSHFTGLVSRLQRCAGRRHLCVVTASGILAAVPVCPTDPAHRHGCRGRSCATPAQAPTGGALAGSWRKDRDSNPGDPCGTTAFQAAPFGLSGTLPRCTLGKLCRGCTLYFMRHHCQAVSYSIWLRGHDSNVRSLAYEASGFPGFPTPPFVRYCCHCLPHLAPQDGLEPPHVGIKIRCLTNLATGVLKATAPRLAPSPQCCADSCSQPLRRLCRGMPDMRNSI